MLLHSWPGSGSLFCSDPLQLIVHASLKNRLCICTSCRRRRQRQCVACPCWISFSSTSSSPTVSTSVLSSSHFTNGSVFGVFLLWILSLYIPSTLFPWGMVLFLAREAHNSCLFLRFSLPTHVFCKSPLSLSSLLFLLSARSLFFLSLGVRLCSFSVFLPFLFSSFASLSFCLFLCLPWPRTSMDRNKRRKHANSVLVVYCDEMATSSAQMVRIRFLFSSSSAEVSCVVIQKAVPPQPSSPAKPLQQQQRHKREQEHHQQKQQQHARDQRSTAQKSHCVNTTGRQDNLQIQYISQRDTRQ